MAPPESLLLLFPLLLVLLEARMVEERRVVDVKGFPLSVAVLFTTVAEEGAPRKWGEEGDEGIL